MGFYLGSEARRKDPLLEDVGDEAGLRSHIFSSIEAGQEGK